MPDQTLPNDDLVEAYVDYLRECECTNQTIRAYRRTLRAADRELSFGLDQSNEPELRAWIWRDGLMPATRAAYFKALNGFYRWADGEGEALKGNPMRRLKKPKVPRGIPRVATDEQVEFAVIEAFEPYRTFGKLAAYGGLRCIEMSRLIPRRHVTEKRLTIHCGKGNKARVVATHPIIWDAVRGLPDGPLTEWDERAISLNFLKHCRRKGYWGLSLHRIRGWHATNGYRATRDLLAVSKDMGHADPDVTAGYIDVTDTSVSAVVYGLPTFGVDVPATPEDPVDYLRRPFRR